MKVLKMESAELTYKTVSKGGKTFKLPSLVDKKVTTPKGKTKAVTKVKTINKLKTSTLRPHQPLLGPKPGIRFRMPDGWALAAGGRYGLKALEFLEEGTDVVHPRWSKGRPIQGGPTKTTSGSVNKIVDSAKDQARDIDRDLKTGGRGLLTTGTLGEIDIDKIIDTSKDIEKVTRRTPLITPKIDTEKDNKTTIDNKLKLDTKQKLSLRLRMNQLTELKTTTDLITPTVKRPDPRIVPPPPVPFGDDEFSPKKKILSEPENKKGYNVFVKERTMFEGKITRPTKFKKMNEQPLTREKALALGGTIADTTPAISFKIKPTKGKAANTMKLISSWDNLKHKFTKKGEVYIEKNEHRIDSFGEVEKISLLGQKSQRRKDNVRYF